MAKVRTLSEKTLVPVGFVLIIATCAIAWGTVRAEVTSLTEKVALQRQLVEQERERAYQNQNNIMTQVMLLRQDVSEIKGEIKRIIK